MKILHLAKYYSPHIGGVEIHLKEINSLLVKMGHEVSVITQKHDSKLADSSTINGVKIIRIPKEIVDDKLKTWDFIKSHGKLFSEVDVVHVHDVFWWVLPIYRSIRKKVFITFHGWETDYPVRFNAKLQRYLYSKMAKDTIHVGEWIKDFYWDRSENITYGAINPKRLRKSRTVTKQSLGSSKSSKKEINISFVGRLSRENEVEKYIGLVNLLRSKNKKVNITWVGEGEFRDECEKLGEVTGFVKNISKYLVGKDLVFASSYLSILEAQLLGNKVCAFYSNKLKKAYLETFTGSKHMLIADSVESMVKKIDFLLRSPKLKKEAEIKAKEFAKKQTWKKVVDLYLMLWNK